MSKVIAFILAGGQGTRLYDLTKKVAKPAVEFGARYKIIDFALSNCSHSQIKTVGVLTQYEPLLLNTYMHNASTWDLDKIDGGLYILPPFTTSQGSSWFNGTAHAIWSHFDFARENKPEHVLILSGDHIYNMDYDQVIKAHIKNNLDVSICVKPVEMDEAHRFGIMNCDDDNMIFEFEEKPKNPKSNLASMGIYLFNFDVLEKYLHQESLIKETEFDFGQNIIPKLIDDGLKIGAYHFENYWKDVGTIDSLWQANMDLLDDNSQIIGDEAWPIYSHTPNLSPTIYEDGAIVRGSIINEGSKIAGEVISSVVSYFVTIANDSVISNTVIHSDVVIGSNVIIDYAIIKSGTVIPDNFKISGSKSEILLLTQAIVDGGTNE